MSPGHHVVWGNHSQIFFFNIWNVRILQNDNLHRTVFFSLHDVTSYWSKQFLKMMTFSLFHIYIHNNKCNKCALGWLLI